MARPKLPFFCPNEKCQRITGTIDDDCMIEFGICKKCYIELVEGRKNPLIDVDFYIKRLKERRILILLMQIYLFRRYIIAYIYL